MDPAEWLNSSDSESDATEDEVSGGEDEVDQENQIPTPRPKKRVADPSRWKRNAIKRAKSEGQEHITYNGGTVPARQFQLKQCRHNCERKTQPNVWHGLFENFGRIGNHERQNEYLRGCVVKKPGNHIDYFVRVPAGQIKVCKGFFLSVHGIKESRLKKKVLDFSKTLADGRGKHLNRKSSPVDMVNTVRQFITELPARESHYSRLDNPHKKFLESNSSLASIYKDYLTAHPVFNPEENPFPHVKPWLFRKIFNTEFNIGFASPRTDICLTCEVLHSQKLGALRQNQEDVIEELENQQVVHWMEARTFYEQLSQAKELGDTDWAICYDFQKNLPLPVTNVTEEYFLSQLWLYNFTIHNLKTKESHMFLYSEHFAKKGSNVVISCLQWYFDNVVPQNVKKVYSYSDNSFGQNKNRFVFALLQHCCNTRFDEMTIVLPVPGHSRMPVDRDFSKVEKKKRKCDKFNKPSDWINLIRNSQSRTPFNVVYVEKPCTDNLQPDGTPVVTVLDFKKSLTPIINRKAPVQCVKSILFRKNQMKPQYREEYDPLSPLVEMELFKPNVQLEDFDESFNATAREYSDFIPIKKKKHDNVKPLLQAVDLPEEVTFYTTIKS